MLEEWDPNSFEDNPIKLPFSRPQVPAPGPWCRVRKPSLYVYIIINVYEFCESIELIKVRTFYFFVGLQLCVCVNLG